MMGNKRKRVPTTTGKPVSDKKVRRGMGHRGKKVEANPYSRRLVDYPFLMGVRPNEGYVFHSDYFEVDGTFGCVLNIRHKEAASDAFPPFWGVNLVPRNLDLDVSTFMFQQTRRMSEKWVTEHQGKAEILARNVTEGASDLTSVGASRRRNVQLATIGQEIMDGASYLETTFKLLVKAPSLEKLDDAVRTIERVYADSFSSVRVTRFMGEQRAELKGLMRMNASKVGDTMHFTSTELAGQYDIMTHGLEDPAGEYVGTMFNEVNTAAVLFDVDGYDRHVVLANETVRKDLGRLRASDMWASKLSQACLLSDHRVVHIILNGADMDRLGPRFDGITYRLDLSHGDVNMFEMFGERRDAYSVFSSQMTKLEVMVDQAAGMHDTPLRPVIHGVLNEMLVAFYKEQKIWVENAQSDFENLRVVGLSHDQYPRLRDFVSYFKVEYRKLEATGSGDPNRVQAVSVLKSTLEGLLSSNGDLFDRITTDQVDGAFSGRRVIYDFSSLEARNQGLAMAQLVNVIGFATSTFGVGDTVIIHGCENVSDDADLRGYIKEQLNRLASRGGRVVYVYDDITRAISDSGFCGIPTADYTVFGNMTQPNLDAFEKAIGQRVPVGLSQSLLTKGNEIAYIRRGYDNVVFRPDLVLGL